MQGWVQILIGWFLTAGVFLLISLFILYRKFSDLKKLKAWVEKSEIAFMDQLVNLGSENLQKTKSGQELLKFGFEELNHEAIPAHSQTATDTSIWDRDNIFHYLGDAQSAITPVLRACLRLKFLVAILAILLLALGINKIRRMPTEILPEFSQTYIEIQTEAQGMPAKEVEQTITIPLERDLLANLSGLNVISSESYTGLSSVLLHFEPAIDTSQARQMVFERISNASIRLPNVSRPPTIVRPFSLQRRFLIIELSSQELSLIEISTLAKRTIAPHLMSVPGVVNVAVWGNRDRLVQIQVDPEKLIETGITLNQVVDSASRALGNSSLLLPEASTYRNSGSIDTPNQQLDIGQPQSISSPDELANIPLQSTSLLLRDVAKIVEDDSSRSEDIPDNETHRLLLVLEKDPGVNILEVTHNVEAELAALASGLPGVHFDSTIFHRASYFEMAISNISNSIFIAVLLLLFVLGIFLNGWRAALISTNAILISLMAALLVLYVRGETLNAMVLAGLSVALGLVIDDAIVDVENTLRRLRHLRREGSTLSTSTIIFQSVLETRNTLFLATLITLLPILPIYFIPEGLGMLFRHMAVSYTLAVLTAMIVALTVTPALIRIFFANLKMGVGSAALIRDLHRWYDRNLGIYMRHPAIPNIFTALIMLVAFAPLPLLQGARLPTFHEPFLVAKLEAAPGTSNREMYRIASRISNELETISGVNNAAVHVVQSWLGETADGTHSAEVWVSIDLKSDYDLTVAAVQRVVYSYPGLKSEVQSFVQDILSQVQPRPSNDIVVRFYGENPDVLRSEGDELQQALSRVAGVESSRVILPIERPSLEIDIDPNLIQSSGVNASDVRRDVSTLLSGLHIGTLNKGKDVVDVVIWSTPSLRQNVNKIRELEIPLLSGDPVYLEDIAEVRMVVSPTVVKREAGSAYLDIVFNVEGRSVAAVAADIDSAVKAIAFPLEYHAKVKNESAVWQASQQNTIIASAMAALGMYLLLQALLWSRRLAFVVMASLPVALCGGILANLFANGGILSFGLLTGSIGVAAVSLRNSVLLFKHYQFLEEMEGEPFGLSLVMRGSRERLAPILMTTLATIVCFLPFVFLGNIPGQEIVYPIATVTIGGMITSTWLNLFVMPSLYLNLSTSHAIDFGFQGVATKTSYR
jgi:Cu/Ag efflux pump CusA